MKVQRYLPANHPNADLADPGLQLKSAHNVDPFEYNPDRHLHLLRLFPPSGQLSQVRNLQQNEKGKSKIFPFF
jgi:hypothetical protein